MSFLLCRKDGNPFNTTVIPPPPTAQPPSIAQAPTPVGAPISGADEPPAYDISISTTATKKFKLTKQIIFIAGVVGVILAILGVLLFVWRCCKSTQTKRDVERNYGNKEDVHYGKSSPQSSYGTGKGSSIFIFHLLFICPIFSFFCSFL